MQKNIGNFSYSSNDFLGKGSYSTVYIGKNNQTNQKVAVKIINKTLMTNQTNANNINGEIETMKNLQDNNINIAIKVIQKIYQEKANLFELGTLDEAKAIYYLKQIIDGYKCLYNLNIIHRDLKASNIFIDNDVVKIADFGFAIKTQQKQIKTIIAGTPIYQSVQMLSNQYYSYLNDIWSIGLIFYEMLHGQVPWVVLFYQGKCLNPSLIDFNDINQYSRNTLDLLNKLLQIEETNRIQFNQILQHPIFQQPQIIQINNRQSYTSNDNKKHCKYKSLQVNNNEMIQQNQNQNFQQQIFSQKQMNDSQKNIMNLNTLIKNLDFLVQTDLDIIVMKFVFVKLIILENKKIKCNQEIQQMIKNQKSNLKNKKQESQQYLQDILESENQTIDDFSNNFIQFSLKQMQQIIRKLIHRILCKNLIFSITDFKIMEFIQQLFLQYQKIIGKTEFFKFQQFNETNFMDFVNIKSQILNEINQY